MNSIYILTIYKKVCDFNILMLISCRLGDLCADRYSPLQRCHVALFKCTATPLTPLTSLFLPK